MTLPAIIDSLAKRRHGTWAALAALATIAVAFPVRADDLDACLSATEQGQSLRRDGHLSAAREKFVVCTREVCPTPIREQCGSWLNETSAAQPMIIVAARDAQGNDLVDVVVSMDGRPLLPRLDGRAIAVDPGLHTLRFESSGRRPVEQRIVVRETEKDRRLVATLDAIVTPPPPEPKHGPPAVAYVLGGVGAVAVTGWGYFGIRGLVDHFGCHACSTSTASTANTELLVSDIAFGAAAVSLGIAVWLFFSKPSVAQPHRLATLLLTLPPALVTGYRF